jgi:hypothetical protein
MNITFQTIVKAYLVVLMVISLLIITDRLTEKTSKPILLGDQLNSTVLVMKKGCVFQYRWEKL